LGAIALDSANNLYVADSGTCVIWKISPAGAVSVAAGVEFACGYNGDNIVATTADLNQPYGVSVDGKGNIFIADSNNNRIRRVNTLGIISTTAGNGTCGFLGDGGPATSAELCFPEGVAISGTGTLYIADTYNLRIRTVIKGTINTYAGSGTSGYNGNKLPALSTNFDDPVAVTLNSQGVLYLIDDAQTLVRRVH
jgi:sugar lactone lactonase YvrE